MTIISANSEVLMHFTIKLEDGSVADSTKSSGKPAKLVMGDGSLTENFERCLVGLSEGETASFTLEPDDAFGQSNPDNIQHMDRTLFVGDAPAEEGTIIAFSGPGGQEIPGVITEVAGESVTVDFNHPLAGHRVIFDVEIVKVS
ncbi:FKBP-type peptidyl-prolyl cis-trans isomerase [Enterovibrio nigricans]|uniref:Peptidyl-prolyl cis-trans isomerase n=1 Tax=Enterovibrio nigricans DSM 22720 TaxID=1121868 RepID=A0A1T4TSS7_9GAMM|nr:FKBP-type peptidyl-prolyl cis-trans isomerase [Enterovibrio nigricans]PKF51900.1 peptidylprolyl isomerase [Enterovibrio nigricans]SKA43487.1 FKBP-type peptidyl-prolyl cis-trans isomerase SlpA [Enterovibrio nigricans DSM 22720]